VTAAANDPYGLVPTVFVDVDLRHDGSFTDPGDQGFGVVGLPPDPDGSVTFLLLGHLDYGTYAVRARVDDPAGNEGVSATQTMIVSPNSGYVGSQPLLDLANGLPYGTPVWTPADAPPVSVPAGATMPVPPGGQGPVTPTVPPTSQAPFTPPAGYDFLQFDAQGRVEVGVHSTLSKYVGDLKNDLAANYGFTATGEYDSQNMVVGWLPVSSISYLSNAAHFDSVDPIYKPILSGVPITTEGDALIKAPQFRAANGVDGSGVQVGVMSDSVNEFGGGLAQSVASGTLPPNVQVLQDGAPGTNKDEGRAMLEIVHSVAPGAALSFYSGDVNGPQGMAVGINALVKNGANVISDDILYPDEPLYNDGVISQAAEGAVNSGVVYTTAAGNNANHAYEAAWSGLSATVGGVAGTFQDIGGGTPLQTFSLAVNSTIHLGFTWDAAYLEAGSPGNGGGNFKVNNDLQVLVTDSKGATLLKSFDANATNTNEAFTEVTFSNTGAFGTNSFALAFNLVSGAAPGRIRWVSFDDGVPGEDPGAVGEGNFTTFGHEVATGVITTGAVNWMTPTHVEPFSALGGNIPILFDTNGNRFAQPQSRFVPIVAAPDGVHTSFFGTQQPDGSFEFSGTSAATAHVAGAAALLLQGTAGITPAVITQYFQQNAIDLHDPTHAGAGLIQLVGRIKSPITVISTSDIYEPNETSDAAIDFGKLSVSDQIFEYQNLLIANHADGFPDYDWYKWSMGSSGGFTVKMTVTAGSNLQLGLFTAQGNGTLFTLASDQSGNATVQFFVPAAAGQEMFVEVKGINTALGVFGTGTYKLDVQNTP
jgi:hypothetical protein